MPGPRAARTERQFRTTLQDWLRQQQIPVPATAIAEAFDLDVSAARRQLRILVQQGTVRMSTPADENAAPLYTFRQP